MSLWGMFIPYQSFLCTSMQVYGKARDHCDRRFHENHVQTHHMQAALTWASTVHRRCPCPRCFSRSHHGRAHCQSPTFPPDTHMHVSKDAPHRDLHKPCSRPVIQSAANVRDLHRVPFTLVPSPCDGTDALEGRLDIHSPARCTACALATKVTPVQAQQRNRKIMGRRSQ